MKKKVLNIIIIFCLIIPYVFFLKSYAAQNDVSFTVVGQSAHRGDTITVIVNMNCTNSFSAANFVLTYDSAVLEYVPYYDANNGIDYNQNCGSTILSGGSPTATILINSGTAGTIKVGYMSTTSVAGKSGEFLKFKFNVKSNAAFGNSTISMSATTLKNSNGNNLTAEYNSGTVSVVQDYTISIISPEWTSLPISQKRKLSITFNPTNAAYGKTLTWSSSNTNIATINSSTGEITAKANGTTTITATVENKTATYTLTVSGILGDIDGDSNITAYEAYRALVLYADQASGGTVNANDVVKLDVEKNGSMSSNDAYLILKYSVGLISTF